VPWIRRTGGRRTLTAAELLKLSKIFLGFALLSGLGWLCDFLTFAALVKVLAADGFWANVVSSYVGVTFVWFVSLRTLFRRRTSGSARFLLGYWTYQFFSILLYSQLLEAVANSLPAMAVLAQSGHSVDILAKLIITPFNLLSNFVFMKLLTRHMPGEGQPS